MVANINRRMLFGIRLAMFPPRSSEKAAYVNPQVKSLKIKSLGFSSGLFL
jgi:hypothetical protein